MVFHHKNEGEKCLTLENEAAVSLFKIYPNHMRYPVFKNKFLLKVFLHEYDHYS